MQVYGVPREIRSYLSLWVVGSILGATQKVDMKYLRKSGVVRLLVAVLDVNSIPDDVDIVVDDCLYDIFFHVESVVKGDDDNFDDADDLDNDDEQFPQDQEMEDAQD